MKSVQQKDWDREVAASYERHVLAEGDAGAKAANVLPLIERDMEELIVSGRLTPPTITAAVRKSMESIDDQRRANDETLNHVIDALNGDTILGDFDPLLNRFSVLGGGLRKANRYLTVVDLDDLVSRRRTQVAQSVAAYDRFAAAADEVKMRMRAQHVDMLGDLRPSAT